MGRGGRDEDTAPEWPPTGFTLGEGGMASPRRGPAPPLRAPGMAGRRRGTGEGPEEGGTVTGVGAAAVSETVEGVCMVGERG